MKDPKKQYDCENIDWRQVVDLFKLVNWAERDVATVKSSFERSTYKCFLFDGSEIIAVGRTVDDGCYYGLIVDVAVHPDYQNQGLGTLVVNYLSFKMEGYKFRTLTAAPGKSKFYEKLGWRRQSSAYIWPANETQEKEHCFENNK